MKTGELVASLGFKAALQQLDEHMQSKGVSHETRDAILTSAEILFEYIPYAIAQKENPSDGKVLMKFLTAKGKHTVKLFGNDGVNCAISIVDLLMSIKDAGTYSNLGAVPLSFVAWGLATLDLINVGNSCEFVQQGYYEAFLKTSTFKLKPLEDRVQQQYMHRKNINITPAF